MKSTATTGVTESVPDKMRAIGRRMGLPAMGVLPAVVLVVAVLLVPLLSLAVKSFWSPHFTLANYREIFTDNTSLRILLRTFIMSVIVTSVTLVLAYPYAVAMSLASPRVRGVLVAVVLIPFWTSLMARTFAWLVLLQQDGPVDATLGFLHVPHPSFYKTTAGVTVGMTQVLLPFMVLPIYSVVSKIDPRLVQAAKSLGAHPVVAFMKVYFPLSLPGVVAGANLVFIISIGFYVTPAVLGSPQNSMISQLIDTKITRLLDWSGGGALAMVLIAATVLVLLIISRLVSASTALGIAEGDE